MTFDQMNLNKYQDIDLLIDA